MSVELKPCPFCGKAPEVLGTNNRFGRDFAGRVWCENYRCPLDQALTPRQWNTRPGEQAARLAMLQKVRDAVVEAAILWECGHADESPLSLTAQMNITIDALEAAERAKG